MSPHYRELRERLSWERLTAAGEIPGVKTFAAAQTIPGRKDLKVVAFTEDLVADVRFTVPPRYEIQVGDRIDDAEVIKVESIKNVQSTVLRWVAYARA